MLIVLTKKQYGRLHLCQRLQRHLRLSHLHLSLLAKGEALDRGGRTSTYVVVHRRTSTYDDVPRRTSTYDDVRRRTSSYVDVRRRTSTYVDMRRRTSTFDDVRPPLFTNPPLPSSEVREMQALCLSSSEQVARCPWKAAITTRLKVGAR